MHRDVKAANVFIDSDGLLRLGDFGYAKKLRAYNGWKCRSRTGTPHYMAPEVWEERPYDSAADMFSFGVLLCEICTGERPYDWAHCGKRMAHPDWRASPRIGEQCPGHFRGLIECLLRFKPEDRPTAAEVLKSALGLRFARSFLLRSSEQVKNAERSRALALEVDIIMRSCDTSCEWISSGAPPRFWDFQASERPALMPLLSKDEGTDEEVRNILACPRSPKEAPESEKEGLYSISARALDPGACGAPPQVSPTKLPPETEGKVKTGSCAWCF